MKTIILSFILISSLGFAQIEKEVGNFNKVTSFDNIDVLLIQSNENKVVLNGKDAEKVEIVNKNGELKIRMPLLKLMQGDNISATVYFKNINAAEANEGSQISSESVIKAINFDIIAKEGAEIKFELKVSRVALKVSSGAKVFLEGQATNQEAIIGSGAVYEGEKLITSQSVITVNAGGEAEIYASKFVDAKVRAGGNITVYGNPKQVNQKTLAGGTIKIVK